jgi:hypothetical protein
MSARVDLQIVFVVALVQMLQMQQLVLDHGLALQ